MADLKNLLCNNLEFPINIDRKALISWNISNSQQVSFSISLYLKEEEVFNTLEINSTYSNYAIIYPFKAFSDYTYKVVVKTKSGDILKGEGFFKTALTSGFNEKAKWIGAKDIEIDKQSLSGNPALYLFKSFFIEKVEKTYIYFAALGLGCVYINGNKAGDDVLSNDFTNYNKTVLYSSIDITNLLKNGQNEIKVIIGDGWYNQTTKDEWGFYKASWRDTCKLIFELRTESFSLYSDTSWLYSIDGEITKNAIRLGEHYDARKAIEQKNLKKAFIKLPPLGKLKSNESIPIKECKEFVFKTAEKYNGGYLLDFNTNLSGYIKMSLKLNKNQKIKIVYGDKLKDGRIDNSSNSQYVYNDKDLYQCDTFIANSDGIFGYKPLFVYHGFQYAEIGGLDRPPLQNEFKAILVRNAFEKTGHFDCSDQMLNKLYEMCSASCESNYTGFPADCPHREKNGWTGDMALSAEQYIYNYRIWPSIIKWIEDIEDSQIKSGQIPCIVPTCGWGYDWGSGPAWDFALFETVYQLYNCNGIIFVADRFLKVLENYFAYISEFAIDSLVEKGLGDWNYPKNVDMKPAPLKLISSCYYLRMAEILQELCSALKLDSKSLEYMEKASHIRKSILNTFCEDDESISGNMTALASVLYFKVVNGELKEKILLKLIAEIEKTKYHYHAGILGVKYINNVLCENGKADIFLKILRQKTYPSFGNWIERGAVSMWEDFEGTNSRSHHMFSDVSCVLMKYIAGIRVKNTTIGKSLVISPTPCDLTKFYSQVDFGDGLIAVKFNKANANEQFEITVPANTNAVFKYKNQTKILTIGVNIIEC